MAIADSLWNLCHSHQVAELSDHSKDVGIVPEWVEVMGELGSVAFAVAVLLGLIYALNLSYPQRLKCTFEVLQKIIMGLDGNKLQMALLLKTLLSC